MNAINDRYYKGFEGYPEIQFIRERMDGVKEIISMWDGYFDSIMFAIEPDDGYWTGLAYTYHVDMPWFDESPWKIPDIDRAISQLRSIIASKLDDRTNEVLIEICNLLIKAQIQNESVWIAYD